MGSKVWKYGPTGCKSAIEERRPIEPPLKIVSPSTLKIILRFVDEIVPAGCNSVWLGGYRFGGGPVVARY
jgi:hypothetical protein